VTIARYLTDQLAVLCPYILAITAACPILKGLLATTDARWSVISASVDDRTDEERGWDFVCLFVLQATFWRYF
jgi:glutamate--cysteine ligase catalytic subunit